MLGDFTDVTDYELVRRHVAGDPDAFGELSVVTGTGCGPSR